MEEEEDTGLTSPHKHIKNITICGAILTGNWQKDSSITKAVRQSPTGLSRKREKRSGRDLRPWEGHRGGGGGASP